MPVALHLDHASIAVPDLAEAVGRLDRRLGLRVTVSPAAPERHGRVHLDRTYLEVSAGGRTAAGWTATMFFLRFEDPDALREHLEQAGIAHRWGTYEGVDGAWDDVEVDVLSPSLATLIRRTHPAEMARDWPPALGEPHRCGARALAAVHLAVPSIDAAVGRLRRLLGASAAPAVERGRARVRLASGELALREDPSARADGIEGVVLETGSLAATRSALGLDLAVEDGVGWLDPAETFGLRLGFVERRSDPWG